MTSVQADIQSVQRLPRNKAIFDEVALQQARILLERSRAAQPDIWSDPEPLVTVRIVTYNRPQLLVERSLASVLNQTYRNVEALVIGDHAGPEVAAALDKVKDPRVRYFNMPQHGPYVKFPRFLWYSLGIWGALKAYELCRGDWMNFLDDDDELTPDHVERLLDTARQCQAEMVFGVSEFQNPDGTWRHIGALACGQICSGAVMFHRRTFCIEPDPFMWLNDEPGDWNMWRRMAQASVRIAATPAVVYRHYVERTIAGDPEARQRIDSQQPTAQELLDDLACIGGERFLQLV